MNLLKGVIGENPFHHLHLHHVSHHQAGVDVEVFAVAGDVVTAVVAVVEYGKRSSH